MRSVTLKSAMTPSFMGRIATMLPGVRPSISLASLPTASTSPVFLFMATMEGSLTTMPLPLAYTRVLAVPRSIARSREKKLKKEWRLPDIYSNISLLQCSKNYYRFQAGFGLLNRDGLPDGGHFPLAVLGRNRDTVRAGIGHRRGEVLEGPVGSHAEDRLIIDQDRGARFGPANYFDYPAM